MKQMSVLLSAMLIQAATVSVFAQTESVRTVTIDGIIYTDNGSHKTWSVKSLADGVVKTHIVIPDSISVDGLMNKVSSVSTGAFDGNTDIETVHLPDSLRFLSGMAFRNCTNLRQINIPGNCALTDRVFENCISLEEIVIKSGFNLVNGSRLFTGCTSLKRVVIEEGDYIGPHFFDGCTSLEELVMPSSMEEIGLEAFAGCYNLKKIKINNTGSTNYLFMSVAEGAFPDMSLLEKAVADAATHEKLKAGDVISGTVSDKDGPMMMVNVVERDSNDRIVAHSLTDMGGNFSFRLVNPDDRIQITCVGYETVLIPIDMTYLEIKMKESDDLPNPTNPTNSTQKTMGLMDPDSWTFGYMQRNAPEGFVCGYVVKNPQGDDIYRLYLIKNGKKHQLVKKIRDYQEVREVNKKLARQLEESMNISFTEAEKKKEAEAKKASNSSGNGIQVIRFYDGNYIYAMKPGLIGILESGGSTELPDETWNDEAGKFNVK